MPLATLLRGLEGLQGRGGLPSAPDPALEASFSFSGGGQSPSSSEPWWPGPSPGPSRKHSVPGRPYTGKGVLSQSDRDFLELRGPGELAGSGLDASGDLWEHTGHLHSPKQGARRRK